MFLYGDVRVRDRVRDRDLLLTYMYTLNFLNNYFIAILTTAAVSFTLVLSPLLLLLPQLVQQQLTCVITLV
jgi:hypothetical protein